MPEKTLQAPSNLLTVRESLPIKLLELLYGNIPLDKIIEQILSLIKQETGLEAVGIRLRNDNDFPYFVQDGFSPDFILKENSLIVQNMEDGICKKEDGSIHLECTCGLVVSGKTDPSNPLFTEGGSAWTNDSTTILHIPAEQDPRRNPRNNCIHEGYMSIALIPIRNGNEIIGLLQLNDRQKNRFTLEIVQFFERLTCGIGIAFMRMRDVTARRLSEKALRESEEKYRLLHESSGVGIGYYSTDGKVISYNAKAAENMNGKPEDFAGKSIYQLYPKEEAEVYLDRIKKSANSSESQEYIDHIQLPTGEKWFKSLLNRVCDASGNVLGTQIVSTEITENIQAEIALRENEEQYRTLFESMNEGFCLHELVLDQNGAPSDYIILKANAAFEKIIGIKASFAVGKLATAVYGVPVAPYLDTYAKVALSGIPINFETKFTPMLKSFSITVFSPAKGMFATIFEDITERKQNLEELRMSQERFKSIVYNSGAGYFFIDNDGIIRDVNKSWLKLYGYDSLEEVIGHHFVEIQQIEDLEAAKIFVERIIHGDPKYCTGEFSRKLKDGSTGYHFFSARPVETGGEVTGIEGFIVDYTEKKRAEEALCESEEKYRNIVQQFSEAFVLTDEQGVITECNNAFEKITDLPNKAVVGKTIWDLQNSLMAPERRSQERFAFMEKVLRNVLSNGYSPFTERPVDGELCRADGQRRNFIQKIFTIPTKRGFRIASITMDTTTLKHTEEVLQKTQKLESLGLLAGGIAHDFNNLLGGIYGYIDMATDLATEPRLRTYLTKTIATIDRGRDLTRRLITFAKGGEPVLAVNNLFPFVSETAQFALSGSNLKCTVCAPENLWACSFDKNQISQVIDNIVINAKQAMPAGGNVEIIASNLQLSESMNAILNPGRYVRISIRDHGIGMPKEILPKIFDPFFTTKLSGYGLGLATCYSIIKRHGGTIEVESEPGRGSTFHIILPAAIEPAEMLAEKSSEEFKGAGTFVVMDDEEVMREVSCDMLLSVGYNVICVKNGKEAIDVIEKKLSSGKDIAGAIFDLTVPGDMGGRDAVEKLRKADIKIPVFASSGHAEDPIIARPQEFGFSGSITKPFKKSELIDLLKRSFLSQAK